MQSYPAPRQSARPYQPAAILISAAASWQLASYFPPFTHYWAGTFGSSVTNGFPRAAAQRCFTRVEQIDAFTVYRHFENSFDAALAAYLHCLRATHPDLAFIGATVSQNLQKNSKCCSEGVAGRINETETAGTQDRSLQTSWMRNAHNDPRAIRSGVPRILSDRDHWPKLRLDRPWLR